MTWEWTFSPAEVLTALALALAIYGVLLGLWVLGVRWVYRLRLPPPTLLKTRAADGWTLALYHRAAAKRRFEEPVLLCHGLAANHHNFDFEPPYSLAHVLAEAGFECFSIDWRGTGASHPAAPGKRIANYCADDHIQQDGPAFLDEVLARTGAKRAFWVGHSLGGLVGYGVAQGPHRDKLAGLIAVGSPVHFQYARWIRFALRLGVMAAWPFSLRQRLMSIALAPFLGHVTLPLSDVIANPRHIPPPLQRKIYSHLMSSISRRMLRQFEDWLVNDAFRSEDGRIDYREGIRRVTTPLLVMGGSADALATPFAIRTQYELSGSADKTLLMLGCAHGGAMEYGHGDLIFGSSAPVEVFPSIRDWLAERATPLAADADSRPEDP